MKKLLLPVLFLATIVVFEFCSSSKKARKTEPAKLSYASSVQPIIMASCSPCHVGSGAKQKKLDSYDAVKSDIDDIIARIQKNPGDRGFMPFKHPKLSDSTIQVFVKWKADGLTQ